MLSVIKVKLKEVLKARKVSVYKLAKDTGIAYNNLHRLAGGKSTQISFDVLGRICDALACDPCDLLVTESAKKK